MMTQMGLSFSICLFFFFTGNDQIFLGVTSGLCVLIVALAVVQSLRDSDRGHTAGLNPLTAGFWTAMAKAVLPAF